MRVPCPVCGGPKMLQAERCKSCTARRAREHRSYERTWTDQELIALLRGWADEYGRSPKVTDVTGLPCARTFTDRFGSWPAALVAADLPPTHRRCSTHVGDGEKFCAECGEVKPLAAFHHPPSSNVPLSYCKPCSARRSRAWAQANRERRRATAHAAKLRSYGLTPERYEELIAEQGGTCAICQKREPTQVDHCHTTGAVRGILCGPCNRMLAQARDDADVLMRGADYVLRLAVGV